jgi:hypothetical protein
MLAIRIKLDNDSRYRREKPLFVEQLPTNIIVLDRGPCFAEFKGHGRNLYQSLYECLAENFLEMTPSDALAFETYTDDVLKRIVLNSENYQQDQVPSGWAPWSP